MAHITGGSEKKTDGGKHPRLTVLHQLRSRAPTQHLRELIGWSGIPGTRPVVPPPTIRDVQTQRDDATPLLGVWHPKEASASCGRLLEKLGHRIGCGHELARGIDRPRGAG